MINICQMVNICQFGVGYYPTPNRPLQGSVFSLGFQVEVGPVKVDVADTESLHTRSVCARPGGPCLLGGSGMPPRKF